MGLRLNGKAQRGGKPQRPQNAQGILAEAAFRIAHAPQHSAADILPSAEGVVQRSRRVHGHGVHRQVAAGQILPQTAGKGHGGGVAVVRIVPVGAEGGDLAGDAAAAHRYRAVLQSGGDGEVGKQGHGLLR